jgi:transcriptional/translational regulatory protein YebC/TACO1
VRHAFSKSGGSLGTSGSLEFVFTRKGVFKIKAEELDLDELELELIDFGLEEMKNEDDAISLYCSFSDFGSLQKALEERNVEVESAELVRLPNHTKALSDEQVEDVIKLIERLEEDDDVINVFHNMEE